MWEDESERSGDGRDAIWIDNGRMIILYVIVIKNRKNHRGLWTPHPPGLIGDRNPLVMERVR